MKKTGALLLLCQYFSISAQSLYNPYSDLENKVGTYFSAQNFKNEKGAYYNDGYLKGKTTLSNFWSATCIPCLEELLLLNKLKESLGITSNQKNLKSGYT